MALLSYYLIAVLGGVARGLGFGALLSVVFGVLYVLISLEDHALLAGSVTLFGCLALMMALTRKVDWYQLSDAISVRRGKQEAVTAAKLATAPLDESGAGG